jgi:alpha-mannosidase
VAALERLARDMDTRGSGDAVVVFNPSSWVRSSYASIPLGDVRSVVSKGVRAVDAAGRATVALADGDSLRFFAREVPPLGFKVFWIRSGRARGGSISATASVLENDFLRVEIDTLTGHMTRIYDKQNRREALATGGRGNVLHLYGDRPRNWDAWDIGYTGEEWTLDSVTAVRTGGDSATRWIELQKPWNSTHVVQRIVLRADEPWITVENQVDWHENRKLLKVSFDWSTRADSAWYEIAYGAIGQPTAPRTQAERAKYEHAGHRWGDLSDASWGVSLLNDSKYGWDTRGSRMRLSLLRAPKWPDSTADIGRHQFRYAVYPHGGDWRSGGTVRRGVEFNQPLLAVRAPPHPGLGGPSWSYASIDAENVYLTALKRAEDTDARVLRLVEWHGRDTRATITFAQRLARVRLATLIEDPLGTVTLSPDRRSVTLHLRPWEIVTLIVEESR